MTVRDSDNLGNPPKRDDITVTPTLNSGVTGMTKDSCERADSTEFADESFCVHDAVYLQNIHDVNVETVQDGVHDCAMKTPTIGSRLIALRKRSGRTLEQIAKDGGYARRSSVQNLFSHEYSPECLEVSIANKLSKGLVGYGDPPITYSDIYELIGITKSGVVNPELTDILPTPKHERIKVVGTVAAGVWREQSYWSDDEQYDIEVGPNPFPQNERFAVRMEGYSMDKLILPGSELECVRVPFGGPPPKPGDIVIAQRNRAGLSELTCKRLDYIDGEWMLRAESTRPEFQEPIPLGRLGDHYETDDDTTIIGIVISAHRSLLVR